MLRSWVLWAAQLFVILAGCSSSQLPCEGTDKSSPACNNFPVKVPASIPTWYIYNDRSETVIVFIHGIFGDNRATWFYKDSEETGNNSYWPFIVSEDETFEKPSIFLAGYYTSPGSGNYSLADISKAIYTALDKRDSDKRRVLDKRSILFVAHSTGGLVARHILSHHQEAFKGNVVGLALFASPSYGSRLASSLGFVASVFNNKLAKELQWGSSAITELDDDYKTLVHSQVIENLDCVEAIENHFIIHFDWLPLFSGSSVVEPSAAGRYCLSSLIPDSNHASIVKPPNQSHESHQMLARFYTDTFKPMALGASQRTWTALFESSSVRFINSGKQRLITQIFAFANFTRDSLNGIRFPVWNGLGETVRHSISVRKVPLQSFQGVYADVNLQSTSGAQAASHLRHLFDKSQTLGMELGHFDHNVESASMTEGLIKRLDNTFRIEDIPGGIPPLRGNAPDKQVVLVLSELIVNSEKIPNLLTDTMGWGLFHEYPSSRTLLFIQSDPSLQIDKSRIRLEFRDRSGGSVDTLGNPIVCSETDHILLNLSYMPERSKVRMLWHWLPTNPQLSNMKTVTHNPF